MGVPLKNHHIIEGNIYHGKFVFVSLNGPESTNYQEVYKKIGSKDDGYQSEQHKYLRGVTEKLYEMLIGENGLDPHKTWEIARNSVAIMFSRYDTFYKMHDYIGDRAKIYWLTGRGRDDLDRWNMAEKDIAMECMHPPLIIEMIEI